MAMEGIVTNYGSVISDSPREAVSIYACKNNSFEDEKQTKLDRHLIGLTLDTPYKASIQHNSDQTHDLVYNPNEMFVWAAGSDHWARWENCNALLISIDPDFLAMKAGRAMDKDISGITSQICAKDPFVVHLIQEMATQCAEVSPNSDLYFESLSVTLAIRLGKNWGLERQILEKSLYQLAPHSYKNTLAYIQKNLTKNITIAQLAELSDLSESHFIRGFRAMNGSSPYQYILTKRLDLAMNMVTGTKMPLSQIAFACGFSSQSHLGTHFKQRFGKTPLQTRKEAY